MPTYTIRFEADRAYAEQEITAPTPEEALAKAQRFAGENYDQFMFEDYDHSKHVIRGIVVLDANGDERATWWDDEWHLRHAAQDLLDAARIVIARWQSGDLAEAVRALAAAVAKAEGGES